MEPGPPASQNKPPSVLPIVVTVVLALIVAGFVISLPSLSGAILGGGTRSSSGTQTSTEVSTSSFTGSSTSTSTIQSLNSPPLIQNGTANIPYPSNYQSLANYTISVINQDRKTFSLAPVTLSPSTSAQQHADSMLYYGYFSHVDTQGYKPYMRYSLLGGVAAMEENIAFISWGGPHYSDTSSVESSIKVLEYSMMYNDSGCCNNGHRDNILTPLHNRVSIGVAYNNSVVYFVEDFENYYIDLKPTVLKYSVSLSGTPLNSSLKSDGIAVFYDPIPMAENTSTLDSGPREYDPGTLIGGVVPPCTLFCGGFRTGITIHANNWQYNSTQFTISFSLAQFAQKYGAGVYTLYLLAGTDTSTALTSISVFEG